VRRPPAILADPDGYDRLRRHRYGALVEGLRGEASFLVKPMFGCLACYVHGRLMLVLADRRPPWRGLLVPMAREHQAALRAEIGSLGVHPVLGKWLCLSEAAPDFEEAAERLVALAAAGDPRLGVEPTMRARRTRAARGRPRRRPRARAASPTR
jgi:hypothetical protein